MHNEKGSYWAPQKRELQEYSKNVMGIGLPGSLCSSCIPIVVLSITIWGRQSISFKIAGVHPENRNTGEHSTHSALQLL